MRCCGARDVYLSKFALELSKVDDSDGDIVLRADGVGVLGDALGSEVRLVQVVPDVADGLFVRQHVP